MRLKEKLGNAEDCLSMNFLSRKWYFFKQTTKILVLEILGYMVYVITPVWVFQQHLFHQNGLSQDLRKPKFPGIQQGTVKYICSGVQYEVKIHVQVSICRWIMYVFSCDMINRTHSNLLTLPLWICDICFITAHGTVGYIIVRKKMEL